MPKQLLRRYDSVFLPTSTSILVMALPASKYNVTCLNAGKTFRQHDMSPYTRLLPQHLKNKHYCISQLYKKYSILTWSKATSSQKIMSKYYDR